MAWYLIFGTTTTPAYSFKQAVATAGATSVAFSSNVTAGDLIVIAFGAAGSVDPTTPSDTVNTVYTKANEITGQNNNQIVYWGTSPSTGPNTVQVTGGGSFPTIAASEFSGSFTLDTSTTSYFPAQSVQTVNIVLASANELIVYSAAGFRNLNNWTTNTVDPGMVIDAQGSNADAICIAHERPAASGTFAASLTMQGGSIDNTAVIVTAFKVN
jgi:hypothetical protein